MEHIYDPLEAIRRAVHFLKPGGIFIGTVPNFYFLYKRSLYLRGRFGEDPENSLTHEHIRFFSKSTIKKMLEDLRLEEIQIKGLWPDGVYTTGVFALLKPFQLFFKYSGFFPELFSVQFVFKGIKTTK